MSEESFIREVDEEVRADQAKKLWDKYGAFVMGTCIGVVTAVAGIKGWQAWQVYQAESAGSKYASAMTLVEQGKVAEAEREFSEIAKDGPLGYASLARFQQAAALAKNGDKAGAVGIYEEISDSSSVDGALRDLARIRGGLIAVDTASLADIESRMKPLNTRTGHWRHSAKEIIALSAFKHGEVVKADKLFNELIADPAAPEALRQRAQIMLAVVSPTLPGGTSATAVPPAGSSETSQ